jgi:O-succinylbenzoic acid--CoA ligase
MEIVCSHGDYLINTIADLKSIPLELLNENEVKAIKFIEKWLKDESFVFKSSGSTGKPKIFEFKKSDLIWSAKQTIAYFNLEKSPQHFFICLDCDFVAGAMLLARALVLNAKVSIVNPSSNPFELLNSKHSYTFTSLVPLQVQTILIDKKGVQILNQFKHVLIGGAKVQSNLWEQLKALKCEVCLTYGMTETLSHVALWNIKTDHYFKLLPNNQITTNRKLCLKIKNIITQNKWLQTNDLVEIKTDGFLIKGRIDFVINSGAFKINALNVEDEIFHYLSLKKIESMPFFVGGINDELLGEKAILCLEKKFQHLISFEDLKLFLKKRLKRYEIPKEIVFVNNIFFTKSQKVDRIKTLKKLSY